MAEIVPFWHSFSYRKVGHCDQLCCGAQSRVKDHSFCFGQGLKIVRQTPAFSSQRARSHAHFVSRTDHCDKSKFHVLHFSTARHLELGTKVPISMVINGPMSSSGVHTRVIRIEGTPVGLTRYIKLTKFTFAMRKQCSSESRGRMMAMR
jgi:hypothetical protein